MVISREDRRHIKVMRESLNMTYSEIAKELKISRWTASRIYRKKDYVPRKATQKQINTKYDKFLKKVAKYRKRAVTDSIYEGEKVPKNIKVFGLKTQNAGVIFKRYRFNIMVDADSNHRKIKQQIIDVERHFGRNERKRSSSLYCVFNISYFDTDSDDFTAVYPCSSYIFPKSEGMETAIKSAYEMYVSDKVGFDNYLVAIIDSIDFAYKIGFKGDM